ncbi:signal peptide peptidase A [Desulfobotulus alkaliphilus]|uniref:Signal peptide peptidase A n=1 Tax=Desulfobotulus alkaliphilus TaxID=622671 RepID=A0A562RQJ9_9BACT|nr:signal peptide peptidase SppA [Desulfobotulus alkaliphilus]TWI71223.1 signal peptide peptidase A [Desulfobotulus alkaliphilus]
MFSRRHPYLFFILLMTAMVTGSSMLMRLGTAMTKSEVQGESIGVVELYGPIMDSSQILEDIRKFRDNEKIRAIVLRVDSPGGGVGPSQEIYRALQMARKEKPVIASFGSVAASGGYYVAAATDGIMANAGTVTGSIGVILGYTNFRELAERIGLQSVVIKSGEHKDMASPVKDLSSEDRDILQALVDRMHRQFVRDVATGRDMEENTVATLADGRIYAGEEAMELGLVDRLGNFEDALSWAAEKAGIDPDKWVAVYPERERSWLWDIIDGGAQSLVNAMDRKMGFTGGYLWTPGMQQGL